MAFDYDFNGDGKIDWLDRITQLENNSSIIGSDTITIENSTVSIAENLDIYCGEY